MICIIRHGQTELNNRSVLQGRSDHPLNEIGTARAEAAAQRLREQGIAFDRVFSSPFIRTIQAARIVAPDLEPVMDDRLIEMDYGPDEGADLTQPITLAVREVEGGSIAVNRIDIPHGAGPVAVPKPADGTMGKMGI